MRRATVIPDPRFPWFAPRRVALGAAVVTAAALAAWAALPAAPGAAPVAAVPKVEWAQTDSPFAPLPLAETPVATTAALPAPAVAPAPFNALSTMVAPGVHITPMSVPPGTVPVPAGPRAEDSEPEN